MIYTHGRWRELIGGGGDHAHVHDGDDGNDVAADVVVDATG